MPNPDRRRWRLPAAALALLAALPASAATLDLRVSAASEEGFRGVVQNNSATAIVRADVRFASRAYVGSRVLNNRSAGDAQADFYAGYARPLQLFDLIPASLDGGVNVSVYAGDRDGPQQRDLDWAEAYLALDAGPGRLTAAVAPDYFGTGALGWRLAGQLRLPVTPATDLTAVLGWNDGRGVRRHTAGRGGGEAYADASLLLNRALPAGFTFYGQLGLASQRFDGTRRPRALLGLRWRWGRQLPGSTGR